MRELDHDFAAAVAQAIDAIGDGVVIADQRGQIAWVNDALSAMLGRERAELIGQPLTLLMETAIAERHDGFIAARLDRGDTLPPDHRRLNMARRADGSSFPVEIALAETFRAEGRYFTAVIRDVSRQQAEEEQREHLIRSLAQSRQHYFHTATHDQLTGLSNREYFYEQLPELARSARSRGELLAVAFVDLDGFKAINDTWGHHVGDRVLEETAERLRGFQVEGTVCARVGGDEFIVAFIAPTPEAVAERAQQLFATLTVPVEVDGEPLHLGASVGVASTEGGARDPGALVTTADAAMYDVKRRGGGVGHQVPVTPEHHARMRAVQERLPQALAREEYALRYRPILSLPAESVVGAAAELWWTPPRRPPVSSREFHHVAERLGLIPALERWSLQQAVRALAQLQDFGAGHLSVTCPVSAPLVQEGDIAAVATAALREHHVAPQRLVVEFPEALLAEPGAATDAAEELRAARIGVAIGDFGGGSAPLGRLVGTAATVLRLDPGIIARADRESGARMLLASAVAIGLRLGRSVVGTGVERAEQRALLAELGVTTYEGPFASEALPLRRLAALMRDTDRPAASPPAA